MVKKKLRGPAEKVEKVLGPPVRAVRAALDRDDGTRG